MTRIGVGIVTYERFDRFKECFDHLLKHSSDVEEILIVDDCSTKDRERYDNFFNTLLLPKFKVIINKKNIGVGPSKNRVLEYFYNKDYDYIFTLENDINIINDNVFNKYIETYLNTGYHYINFALHGPHNHGRQEVRKINNYEVAIYPHLTGAFSLHTRKLIEEVGYYDEEYFNAYEHVDYCYLAAKKELTAPFWMFLDVKDSHLYLEEQQGSLIDSTTKSNMSWMPNVAKGAQHFYDKYGVSFNEIPQP